MTQDLEQGLVHEMFYFLAACTLMVVTLELQALQQALVQQAYLDEMQ